MSEPLFAISWGWQYPEVCPFLSWRSNFQTDMLHAELGRPATSLCLFPAQYSDLPALAANGQLMALDGHFSAADLSRNPPWLLDLVRVENSLVALPEDITLTCLLARSDLLSRLGLKPPADWAALLEQAQYLKRKLGQPGLVLPKPTASTFAILVGSLLSANGVNPMEDLRLLLKEPRPLKETYRMMHAFREQVAGLSAEDTKPQPQLASLFNIGEAPYFLCYPSTVRGWSKEILQRIRAYPIPKGPSLGRNEIPRALVKGGCWCIPRNTRAPELAVKALRILRRTSIVKKIELTAGHPFSALRPLWDDPQVRRHLPLYRDASRFFLAAQPPIVFQVRKLSPFGVTMKASFEANEPDEGWLQRLYLQISEGKSSGLKHQALRRAVGLIDQRIEQLSDLKTLAKSVGLSVTHLERLFRREMGLSCGKYLRKRRMEYARDLLTHSTLAIKEIAYRLGYAHPTHFSRDVRGYWKKSPAQLRDPGDGAS